MDDIKPDYTEFFYATPYPGTKLYRMALEEGVIDKPYRQWISSKQVDKPVMCIGFTEEELIKARSRLHNKVIWKNYMTMMRRPRFLLGSASIILKGFQGLPEGIKRFAKTGKIDSIFLEILHAYRGREKSV